MMRMKVLELLKERLPAKYVLAIIENMEEMEMLHYEAEGTILDELETIFDWENSNEGYDFWDKVFNAVEAGEQLPILPFRAIWRPNTYIATDTDSYILNVQGEGVDLLLRLDHSEKPKTRAAMMLKEQHLAFCN